MPRPSIITRLSSLLPGFQARPTPLKVGTADRPFELPTESPEERATRLIEQTRRGIEEYRRRPAPSTGERIPANYYHGFGGRVWFLPYADSATQDSPEIRAAMRQMIRSPYVKAAWETQLLTVASEDFQVQPSEEGNSEAEEQAAFVRRVIEKHVRGGLPAIVRAIAAPFGPCGFTIAEKVWGHCERGPDEGKIVLTALKAKDTDPAYLHLEGDSFNNLVSITSSRQLGERYPITDFVYARYLPVFDEPLGQAAFRPSYSAWWMLDTVDKLRVIHHEKRMAGMLVGTYASDDDKGPLEDALAKARTATWMSIPEGTRVEAIALSTASEPDYKSFVESKREEVVIGIAFATLQILQGNVPDARGDTKVQKQMSDLGPWLLMALVQDAINSQIIPDLIDFNYPYPAGGDYPRLTFGAVSNAEHLELLQLLQSGIQAGLTPSKKYYAKALGIQQADPNDPDDVLGGQPPPGGPGGFGGVGAMLGGQGPFGGGGVSPFSEAGFTAFGWDDWRQIEGGKWRSPGGRVLSDAEYQARKSATPDDDSEPSTTASTLAHAGAIGTGAAVGGFVGGPLGALVGGAVASAAARLVGYLDQNDFQRRVEAGDPDTLRELGAGTRAVGAGLLNAAPKIEPADPAATRSAWQSAVTGLPKPVADQIGNGLESLATERNPTRVGAILSGIARVIKAAGSIAMKAVRSFAESARRTLGPYGWWAGSILAATAIVAAPAVAVGAGLIPVAAGAIATAPAAASAVAAKRVMGGMAAQSARRNWGSAASYAERFGEWQPYTGERGGRGWVDAATGEVRYQIEKPSDSNDQDDAKLKTGDQPDLKPGDKSSDLKPTGTGPISVPLPTQRPRYGQTWDEPDWIEVPATGANRKWQNLDTGREVYGRQPKDRPNETKQRAWAERQARLSKPATTTYATSSWSSTAPPDEQVRQTVAVENLLTADSGVAKLLQLPNGANARVMRYQRTINGVEATPGLSISIDHPDVDMWDRQVSLHTNWKGEPDGTIHIHNSMFFLKPRYQGSGFGTAAFSDQVRGAFAAGANSISTMAGKGRLGRGGAAMNGYYTWATLGYDAELSQSFRRRLPPELKSAKTVQDLLETPEGERYWKDNGYMTEMNFDLTPGSPSLKRLNSYLERKGKPPIDTSEEAISRRNQVIADRKSKAVSLRTQMEQQRAVATKRAQMSPIERIWETFPRTVENNRARLEAIGLFDEVQKQFAKMLDSPEIVAKLGQDPERVRERVDNEYRHIIYTTGVNRFNRFWSSPEASQVHHAWSSRASDTGLTPEKFAQLASTRLNFNGDPIQAVQHAYEDTYNQLMASKRST